LSRIAARRRRGHTMNGPLDVRTMKSQNTRAMHRVFELAILLKGIDGLLETLGGLLILFVPLHSLDSGIRWVLVHELSTESHDLLAHAIKHLLDVLSLSTKLFASLYLICHGLVKIFLVYALWREKLWAFPVALWFIAVFVAYQIYRYTHTHSMALLIFALVDVCVAWFIWREYLARNAAIPLPAT
jgi:uncharacterized membrane protein